MLLNEFNFVVDDEIVHDPFGLELVLPIALALALPAFIAPFFTPFLV